MPVNASTLRPYALALLRVTAAYMFFLHGAMKLLGGVPWVSLQGLAMGLELVGGALLVLGLFVRPVAFILSGEMAFAYFIAHASASNFWLPLKNHGESAALFCFIFLYLAAAGGGAFALDGRRR
ncbi:DoxX family protein [Comamonas flocculans]|uniref:DoxX family protein n=1 Tax=Comamonas flocculans TaxID=2597701 RepID=A0A5B8RUI9_9BURK|nr:DoxX family protein [Comamonas flocculans]QEA11895.1 DoxX family protein [Comamonas flocculans]